MPLNSISPIDGRYAKKTAPLSPVFSEKGLMSYRVKVEAEYLIALSSAGLGLRKFSEKEKKMLRSLHVLSQKDAQMISDIELKGYKQIKATDHDVKAVEYFIKEKLSRTSLAKATEWVHFALTSEDTNNLAYGLMISEGVEKIMAPKLQEIVSRMKSMEKKYRNLPMLARTHGQPASPTTFGKEMAVFAYRLQRALEHLKGQRILVKLNGATGNYNAHVAAFPKFNWPKFSKDFVAGLNKNLKFKLELNPLTAQIEPHDSYIELFDRFRRMNTMLIDFNQDMWRYISDEWVIQKPVAGTVGSSTMPHKINPIKFENSEGNLGTANALFEFFARKLPVSRLQRDLSDSTVERNIGVAFAHSLVAYEYLLAGLDKIEVNRKKILEDLDAHPEVIAEAIQTILRREGEKFPYEKLKELTRGKKVSLEDLRKFIDTLPVSAKTKNELKKITPRNYIGFAGKI